MKTSFFYLAIILFFWLPSLSNAQDPPADFRQDIAIQQIQKGLEEMKNMLVDIHSCLEGNGHKGLKTRVAINEEKVANDRYWLGGIGFAILALAFGVVRNNFTEGGKGKGD